ncbi:MAG: CDGSH iron-sulfur domain-containing protein [Parvularculaceae bacterium]|nr:CDGSH iron-sulfur domain-containing protein [Parvularculaceae bacterium]
MSEPVIAAVKPCLVQLEEGRAYSWCACGRSARQPFCDGSHKGTGIEPVRFRSEKSEEALLCACKRTKTPPYCDGSHNALKGGYETAKPVAAGAPAPIAPRGRSGHPTSALDGGCFVRTIDPELSIRRGPLSLACAIGADDGANLLSMFRIAMKKGASDPFSFPDAEILAFVIKGVPILRIDGARCETAPETGVLIMRGETLAIENPGEADAVLTLTVCPSRAAPVWMDGAQSAADMSSRTFRADSAQRRTMADRFYQVLNGPENGSREVTQFIGEIPQSCAEPHQHLYEEAIVILSGEGFMHTQTRRAAVGAGDIIFLPRKQMHALECVSPNGMRLMGAFYPAGSPALNY